MAATEESLAAGPTPQDSPAPSETEQKKENGETDAATEDPRTEPTHENEETIVTGPEMGSEQAPTREAAESTTQETSEAQNATTDEETPAINEAQSSPPKPAQTETRTTEAVASDQNIDLEAGTSAPTPPPNQDASRHQTQAGEESDHHGFVDFRDIHILHHHKAPLAPSTALTPHQIFYIFGLDGVGAMLISGAINFAIAYAMYTTQDTTASPIRLFKLPNTLAGDAVVTIFLQSIITWMVELVLVSHDLRTGSVQPAGFAPEPKGRLARWYLLLDDQTLQGRRVRPRARSARWLVFVFRHVLRAALVGVVAFVLLWGPSVGILTAVGTRCGGDWCYEKRWAPEIFKGVFGGVLALLTTPPMAALWVFRAGWLKKRADESESGPDVGTDAAVAK